VQLEAVAEDRFMKLVEEHFDIAIRVNPCKQIGRQVLCQRQAGPCCRALCANTERA